MDIDDAAAATTVSTRITTHVVATNPFTYGTVSGTRATNQARIAPTDASGLAGDPTKDGISSQVRGAGTAKAYTAAPRNRTATSSGGLWWGRDPRNTVRPTGPFSEAANAARTGCQAQYAFVWFQWHPTIRQQAPQHGGHGQGMRQGSEDLAIVLGLKGGTGGDDAKPIISSRSTKTLPVQIPDAVLQQAHGLVIYTVIRAGFNLSGSRGSGVVLARLPTGGADSASTSSNAFRRWSGPSAFSVYGAGASLIGGFDVSESVCVLNSAEAVRAFYHGATSRGGVELGSYQRNAVRTGGGESLAVAPGPTTTAAAATPPHGGGSRKPTGTLGEGVEPRSLHRGSVDGTIFREKRDVNESFYDEPGITPDCILRGNVRPEFKGAAGAVLGGIAALGFGELGV
ncbi:hypothetical protein PG984_007050 [Apiospora sp. TS-2023a]